MTRNTNKMLSRHASTMSATPRRSKSELLPRSQNISDPFAGFENEATAHSNAVTAAGRAFYQTPAFSELIDDAKRHGPSSAKVMEQPNVDRFRRKSIRFAGATAIPGRNFASVSHLLASHESGVQSSSSTECRAEPDSCDLQKPGHMEPHQRSHFGTTMHDPPSGAVSKTLSSARSMFTLRDSSVPVHHSDMPKPGRHLRRRSVRSSESLRSSWPTRAKGKTPAYSGAKLKSSTRSDEQHSLQEDAIIQLAREEFLRQQDQNCTAHHRPSHSFSLQKLGMIKKMRRSGEPASSDATNQPVEKFQRPRHHSRAQRVSKSVRSKFRTIFHRSAHHPVNFPAQQLEASRSNFYHKGVWADIESSDFPSTPPPDANLLRRIDSRETLTHETSRNCSRYDSEFAGSRIANWSKSTTLSSVKTPVTLDKKRLSVVGEDSSPHGPHLCSQINANSPIYAAFRQPLKPCQHTSQLETQRVFSALQREIQRKNSDNVLEEETPQNDSISESRNLQIGDSLSLSSGYMEPTVLPQKEFTGAADIKHLRSIDQSTASNLRGSLYEIGSSFFPASTRIERDRGTSPFRKMTMTTSFTNSLAHGTRQFATKVRMHQGSLENIAITEGNNIAHAQSPSTYSSNSDTSASSARSLDSISKDNLGTAKVSESSHRILTKWPKHTDDSIQTSVPEKDCQLTLAAQATFTDPSVIHEDLTMHSLTQPPRHLRERAQTSDEAETKPIPADDFARGHGLYSPAYQKSLPSSIENDRARWHASDRTPLEGITPQANSEMPNRDAITSHLQIPGASALPTAWDTHHEGHLLGALTKAKSGPELSPRLSIRSRYGMISPACTSCCNSLHRVGRICHLHRQTPHSLRLVKAGLQKGVRVGYLSHVEGVGSQIALNENVSPQSQLRSSNESVATGSVKGAGFDRCRLVDSFLKDRRRDTGFKLESSHDVAFL